MEQKPEPRVVSKGEYARIKRRLFVMRMNADAMDLLATVTALVTVMGVFIGLQSALAYLQGTGTGIVPILTFLIVALSGAGFHFCNERLEAVTAQCREMDNIVLHVHAHTSDSLVRASQEPVQAQEGVLLRAAAQTQEQHEEQLLRPTTGK